MEHKVDDRLCTLERFDESWCAVHTGGGCMAYQCTGLDTGFLMLTNHDAGLPVGDDGCLLGFYDDAGESVYVLSYENFDAVIDHLY